MRVSFEKTSIRKPDLFVCNYEGCNMAFRRKKSLYRHLRAHLKTNEKQCPHCELHFPETANLKAHINRKHLGLRLTCPDCHEDFSDKSSLLRHRKRIHDYKTRDYRTTKDIIKEVQETRPSQLLIERVSTLPATARSAAAAATPVLPPSPSPSPSPNLSPSPNPSPSPSPSPPPMTPPTYDDANDFWNLYGNMDVAILPQATEVHPALDAGFPLEELFPATTTTSSSFFPLLESFQSPISIAETSGAFNNQASASTFADYSAVADPDLIDIYAELFGCRQF
ncbi:hypothetical protein IW261DRAFT_1604787 [Armillaria novae-zelandiae]|uniref:C2H2-type domain-containing protein n=1 Tax=Armillaria novae-zelandiae TaxID=153914 RepID=A0AA39PIK3_9AGAR|nr:hypothetical protein IW261DRAFT_1604787 [Armillaria novae-zelandiae]